MEWLGLKPQQLRGYRLVGKERLGRMIRRQPIAVARIWKRCELLSVLVISWALVALAGLWQREVKGREAFLGWQHQRSM